jgi:dihydroorotase
MLTMADKCGIDHALIIDKMCHTPARLFSVARRGFIRKGYYADLVLVSNSEWTLRNEQIESKCKWSPLEGETFSWKVEKTFCNGRLLYSDGKVDTSITGLPIEFDRE